MVKVKFVDIKYLDNPRSWNRYSFSACECNFANAGIATVVCPAIRQIMQAKGILYLFDNKSHTNTYILTDCDKEKDKIKTTKHECIHRIR